MGGDRVAHHLIMKGGGYGFRCKYCSSFGVGCVGGRDVSACAECKGGGVLQGFRHGGRTLRGSVVHPVHTVHRLSRRPLLEGGPFSGSSDDVGGGQNDVWPPHNGSRDVGEEEEVGPSDKDKEMDDSPRLDGLGLSFFSRQLPQAVG